MYHLRKLKSLLLLLLVAVSARAQISNGKVYNIVSVEYSKSLAITSGEYITVVPTNENGSEQLWYAEGDDTNGYTLRSLCSGYYLRSSNGQSSKWTMVETTDANCKLKCYTAGSNYTFRATNTTNDWHSMHLATSQGSHIVGWTSSASATQWRINEVSVTAAELETLLAKADEVVGAVNNVTTYQAALNNLFSDKACTQLKKSFASESAVTSDADYRALPTTLQQMVLKVYRNSWAEDNYDDSKSDWDADYAKKYRVQFYEPYNEPECAASALGLNAHTNLNNPTGIFANVQDILYVMVDGAIADGSALYLASYTGHGKLGGFREGVQLKQGLNIIPSFEAGTNYCINYVVHTFDTEDGTKKGNKAKARKLSDYDDLKIHIEGGYINGYWNKMGDYNQTGSDVLYDPDTHTDWNYIAERATQTDVTILGEYITLQFPLHSAIDNDGHSNNGMSHYLSQPGIDIKDVIDEWDKVMLWERLVMGLLDEETTKAEAKKSLYSEKDYVFDYIGDDTDGFESGYGDYYNVHGLSFGTPHGYMYGSWDHCGYHYNTMGAIMNSMITDAGSHWGPAHEIGHQHQGLLNLNGLTEVTNNLFSNIVLWYVGKTTSRVNGSALEPIMEVFSTEGTDFFSTNANVFITTQMYYKLFLYYHVLGHNPKFYPKLFELLRQDPMSGGYYQQGSTSILHFYKKCCEAAGEDLTEFFRAYSFFSVMTDRLVGDYGNSEYTQTQKDIDDAIAEVKAMAAEKGWEQNIAVLFINDDTGEKILSHRDDVEYLAPYESADSELGCYASYVNTTEPNYTYTITGNTMTMTGEGGTGIAIFNKNGELIGFSDNKTFKVSDECAVAIASGQAEVVAMKADNTRVEAVDIMDTDDTEAKHALLGELLNDAKAIVELTDETNSKLGYYRKDALTDLQTAYDNAKKVYDNRTVASYDAVYDALNVAYSETLHNDYARIGLVVGNAYRLQNKNYPERFMSVAWKKWKTEGEGENAVDVYNSIMVGETTELADVQKWYFEESGTEGRYYIKNKSTEKYVADAKGSTEVTVDKTKEEAQTYKFHDMGNGLWVLVGSGQNLHHGAWNYSYNVLGWWDNNATASQWYITAVELDDVAETLYDLKELIGKTEALIDEVGYAAQVQLQATDSLAAFHLYCNALYNRNAGNNNGDNSMNTAKLLDGDPATHIHTDYRGGSTYEAHDALDHYLRVDLGSGNAVSEFKFTYTTRNAGDSKAHPKKIKIEGSNNLITFEEITTLPRTGESALPGANNDGRGTYTSPTITSATPYRYLRFMVTETQGTGKSYGNHPYFYMAEFDLELENNIVKVDDKYSSQITVDELSDAFKSLLSAQEIVENKNSTQYTAAYTALKEYYDALLADKNVVETSNLTALKNELFTLMGSTTTLIGECGKVTVTPGTFNGKAPLQTTEANGAFYLWTNAQSTQEVTSGEPKRGYLLNLLDGNNQTYFHSDYSGANSTDGRDHHITVDLGENNKTSEFSFKYITRNDAETNYPTTIKVLGSENGTDYEEIDVFTDLPTGNAKTYESELIKVAKEYSYLRFMVTENSSNVDKGGHPFFHMAEFELNIIGIPESYTAELGAGAGDAGTDLLIETYCKNAEAQSVHTYATSEMQVEAAIAKLQAQYNKLLAAQQSSDKATLRDLVARTTTLIGECGTLSYAETLTKVNLQANDPTGSAYLSCPNLFYNMRENPGDSDTNCADLLDGNSETYIHTNYEAASNTYPHYLQVAFGTSEIPLQFQFSYSTRHNGANQVPKHIIVKGSNDGVNFNDVLGEYDWEDGNSPLPTTMNTSWTAPNDIIGYYKYLRFYVTESPQTNPYFAMSEFSMSYTGYAIKWNNAQHGTATNAHLIAAYEARNAADELLATTTTKEALQAATTALQEKYDELDNALHGIQNINFTISSNVPGGGVIYNEVEYTTTLSAPSTLTAEALTAMQVDGYVAESITRNGTEISIIYNKVYTVQVVGIDATAGGVTLGETTYVGDATFNMLESSFNIENFNVIDLSGYAEYKTFDGTTITVTYKKIYNVVVEGVDAANGGVTDGKVNYPNGTFEMLETEFNIENFTAIEIQGYKPNKTFEDATITIIYNKVYTIQITGGEGEGRVIFGEKEYAHNGSFDVAKGSFEATDLTAKDVTGYNKSEVTVNHETGIISVTYTLDRTELETLIGETNELMQACLVFVNSAYVTEQLLTNTSTAITAAMETFSKEDLTYVEYTDAVSVLQTAYSTLNTAKGNAENEVAARNQLKEQLRTLIVETETLIASCYENDELKYINSDFVTDASIAEIRIAIKTAQEKCKTNATTEGEYNASLEALGQMKANLATAIAYAKTEASDRLTSREALREKIEALGDIIDQCGVVEWGKYPTERVAVSLTEANLSTNAQEKTEGPIANLLKDDASHFHSSWKEAVGEEHYLQVDLGEGKTLQEFVFGYTTRSNGPHPYIIVVSGSNDENDSFEEIKVFNSGLPNSGSTSWEATAPIIASQPYRYLRFTVTKSSNLRDYGEYCFAMSKFELKTITYSESEDYYVEYLNPNGSVTEEELLAAYRTMIAAGELDNVGTTKAELDAKIEELQNLSEQLTTKRTTLQLPVELTADIKNPVLYTLKSKRGDAKALQYDPAANHMFSIADASDNVKQMFYFTMGDTKTQVYVHPFVAGEQVLAAVDLSAGKEKVVAAGMSTTEAMVMQWTFEEETIDGAAWYSLDGIEAPYFSNHGGGSNKMGFHTSKDDGSRFQFIEVDESTIEGSSAYHSLKVYYDEVTKVNNAEIEGGSNPYYYPKQEADAYNEVYANTTSLLAGDASYEENLAAYKALKVANEALELNMPSADKFYRFVSVVKGDGSNAFVYANPADNKMYWATDKGNSDATAIWKITPSATEGKYNISNLHTGSNINGFIYYNPSPLSEVEGDIEIESLSYNDGQIGLKHNGTMMHAQGGGAIVHWGTGANDGSAWRIVEVAEKELSDINFALTIGELRHAGLFLNYSVEIPDGVEVFIAHSPEEAEEGDATILADKIKGTVLPARTAVIVKGDAGTYEFKYTTSSYDGDDDLTRNKLGGSAYLKYQQVKEEGNRCCAFGQRGGIVGLYKNWVQYVDANGSTTKTEGEGENATSTDLAKTDNGTHFMVPANKVYYEYEPVSTANASAFRFRLISSDDEDDDTTTTIDELLFGSDAVIYNLYGQRIVKVVVPGFYIVNGKKMYVSEKMIQKNGK